MIKISVVHRHGHKMHTSIHSAFFKQNMTVSFFLFLHKNMCCGTEKAPLLYVAGTH